MSAIIFLISSFFGSKPSARIATLSSFASIVPVFARHGGTARVAAQRCEASGAPTRARGHPRTRAVGVKEIEGLPDLLLLLLRQLRLAALALSSSWRRCTRRHNLRAHRTGRPVAWRQLARLLRRPQAMGSGNGPASGHRRWAILVGSRATAPPPAQRSPWLAGRQEALR